VISCKADNKAVGEEVITPTGKDARQVRLAYELNQRGL